MPRRVNVVHVNLHFVASPSLCAARTEGGSDHGVPSFATAIPTWWSGRYDPGFPDVLVGVGVPPGRVEGTVHTLLLLEIENGVRAGNEWADMRRCILRHVPPIDLEVWTGFRDGSRSRSDEEDVVV
jgi:hypothetical protein